MEYEEPATAATSCSDSMVTDGNEQATSIKPQATSIKPQATSIKAQATSIKPQATSIKPQATSPTKQVTVESVNSSPEIKKAPKKKRAILDDGSDDELVDAKATSVVRERKPLGEICSNTSVEVVPTDTSKPQSFSQEEVTHPLTHSPTHPVTHSLTHSLTHSGGVGVPHLHVYERRKRSVVVCNVQRRSKEEAVDKSEETKTHD